MHHNIALAAAAAATARAQQDNEPGQGQQEDDTKDENQPPHRAAHAVALAAVVDAHTVSVLLIADHRRAVTVVHDTTTGAVCGRHEYQQHRHNTDEKDSSHHLSQNPTSTAELQQNESNTAE